jgi:hypothetical protein
VVVGGSGNCLMEHGNENDRGFRPERKVAVRRDRVSVKQGGGGGITYDRTKTDFNV